MIVEKLNLSTNAERVVKRLINSKDLDKVGQIAAVDPQTGETFYGKTVVEAAKIGRKAKKDPKAIFFFVKVGYPAVHVIKNLRGYIYQECFPKVKGYIQDRRLYLATHIPENIQSLEFVVDTGCSETLVLDKSIIQNIDRDYLGYDTAVLAEGVVYPVKVYLSNITVNALELNEIVIIEMKKEYLMGMTLIRSICKRAIFAFDNDEVLFED